MNNTFSPFSPPTNINKDKPSIWTQLIGASLSLTIYNLAIEQNHPTIVLTPDLVKAHQIEQELQFFNTKQISITILPDWETLPYDYFSPHQDITSQRLFTLYQLLHLQQGIVIVPLPTLMHRFMPRNYLEANSFILNRGQTFKLDSFRNRLQNSGYRAVTQVIEHGEYAVRGSIFDLFPMGSEFPYRIDLFDDQIDSIRIFDPETQRSHETLEQIRLLPAREFPLTEEAITHFRQTWRREFSGNPANSSIYQSISQGESAAGIEYYLPLFFDNMQTLFDYLPEQSTIIRLGHLEPLSQQFWQEIQERYEQLRHDVTRPLLDPKQLFLPTEELFANMKQFPLIQIYEESTQNYAINFNTKMLPNVAADSTAKQPLHALQTWINSHKERVLFCAETAGRREALLELLKDIQISPKVYSKWDDFIASNERIGMTVAPIEMGTIITDPPISLIAESQLFGQQVLQRRLRKQREQNTEAIIRDLSELKVGAPVVHLDHGVGRYLGLQTIKTGQIEAEFLTLAYEGDTKLYVPVTSLHIISRYSGADPEHAPLHRLGTSQWEKAKRKALEKMRDVAAELLDIYARRAAKPGFAFNKPDHHYYAFAASFPFEETPDQQLAINNVIADMTQSQPMDRLVCGDVGFGKTEVAIRAAFIAVQSNKQVAVLVPTTLLAEQHLNTFQNRFAQWPIRIEAISRFRSAKEQNKIIVDLNQGKIDVIIGTHKLLQPNVKFKSLGLLIIDEEHRFGVQQKEKIKSLRAELDILTLTATPIPRTLNMAMASIRDLSFIATPPARRLSVKTFVREFNKPLIREAVMREIMRGGQVYFLYNDVQTIHRMANELHELIPEARIAIGHGQMPERELEKVMSDFYHLRFNLLLATTIIESGIDVPTANTIIIHRADRFGLAQLHQLRGRVGRSHHQAYAYLLTPPPKLMTPDARKRLEAIESLEDLGVGFTLATHDLEIRGAGELLGEEQSGQMHEIGFSLYMELLEQTVKAIKAGKEPSLERPLAQGTEINLQVPALIPETYVPDVHTRLVLYKRIASANNSEDLHELQVELVDRFGLLPNQVKNLFSLTELKLVSQPLGIRKMDISANQGIIEFSQQPNIDIAKLIRLVQTRPKEYQFNGAERLKFSINEEGLEGQLISVRRLLKQLTPEAAEEPVV